MLRIYPPPPLSPGISRITPNLCPQVVHEQVHSEQRWALFKNRIAARVNTKFKDIALERSAMALKKAKAVRALDPAPHSARLSQTTARLSQASIKHWSQSSKQPATSRNHQPAATFAPAPPALPLHSSMANANNAHDNASLNSSDVLPPDSLETLVASNMVPSGEHDYESKHSRKNSALSASRKSLSRGARDLDGS